MLDKIRLYLATRLLMMAVTIVNKKTLEGFGLVITVRDWVEYCKLRETELKKNTNKG